MMGTHDGNDILSVYTALGEFFQVNVVF